MIADNEENELDESEAVTEVIKKERIVKGKENKNS